MTWSCRPHCKLFPQLEGIVWYPSEAQVRWPVDLQINGAMICHLCTFRDDRQVMRSVRSNGTRIKYLDIFAPQIVKPSSIIRACQERIQLSFQRKDDGEGDHWDWNSPGKGQLEPKKDCCMVLVTVKWWWCDIDMMRWLRRENNPDIFWENATVRRETPWKVDTC